MDKVLFIQIPCYNEEANLGEVIKEIPTNINGISRIEILIIDDGSNDNTFKIAMSHNVKHYLKFNSNRGLSAAFQSGLEYCLAHGADIVVNTDGDNQYCSTEIEKIIVPILLGDADVVVGDRNPGNLNHFGFFKQFFQEFGSEVTSLLCGMEIRDATSGFRSYTKEAAASISITNPYTYTLESLIQLSFLRFRIAHIQIDSNLTKRPSRLFKSTSQYIFKNGFVLLKSFVHFSPMKFFGALSLFHAILAMVFAIPTLKSFIDGNNGGHIQSLIISSLLTVASVQYLCIGLIGDSIRSSRIISQRGLAIQKMK